MCLCGLVFGIVLFSVVYLVVFLTVFRTPLAGEQCDVCVLQFQAQFLYSIVTLTRTKKMVDPLPFFFFAVYCVVAAPPIAIFFANRIDSIWRGCVCVCFSLMFLLLILFHNSSQKLFRRIARRRKNVE